MLDVEIQLPQFATAPRAVIAGHDDPPTAQLDATTLARASAIARADTVPVPRTRPVAPHSPIEPSDEDTGSIALVETAAATHRQPAPAGGAAVRHERVIDIKKAVWAIVGVIMLAALTTAAILAVDFFSKKLGPKTIALDYATLVVQGQIESASKLAQHTNGSSSDPLLSDAVYAKVVNRPVSASIASFAQEGNTATATVTYKLADGTSLDEDYHLVKDGRTYVLFDRWRFEPFALATLQVTCDAPGQVTAAGVDISANAITSPSALAAFPGSYPIEYVDSTGTFGPARQLAKVAQSGQSTNVALAPEPGAAGRAKVQQQVQQQVDALMDKCVGSKLLDAVCGAPLNAVGATYRGKDVTFKVASHPKAEVRYVSGVWSYAALKGGIAATSGGQTFEHLFNSVGTLSVAKDGTVTLQPSPLPSPGSSSGSPSAGSPGTGI